MAGQKVGATGTVSPGTPSASLAKGKYAIKIDTVMGENAGIVNEDGSPVVSENMMVSLTYPDGWVKEHQVKNMDALMERVTSQLRNRYGVTGDIKVVQQPEKLKPGQTIEVEV